MAKNDFVTVDTEIVYSEKVEPFLDEFGTEGMGVLVLLWAFMGLKYPSGNITSTQLTRVLQKLTKVNAVQRDWIPIFIRYKWIDDDGDGNFYIHDWHDHQPHILEFLEKQTETRAAKVRAGKASARVRREKSDELKKLQKELNSNSTQSNSVEQKATPLNTCSPTLPYPTLPNPNNKKKAKPNDYLGDHFSNEKHKEFAQKVLDYIKEKAGKTYDMKLDKNILVTIANARDRGHKDEDFFTAPDNIVNKHKGKDWFNGMINPVSMYSEEKFSKNLNDTIDEAASIVNF